MQEVESHNTPTPITNTNVSVKSKLWTFLFALMYPIITAFGLLFTVILAVFSAISRVLVFILKKITRQK